MAREAWVPMPLADLPLLQRTQEHRKYDNYISKNPGCVRQIQPEVKIWANVIRGIMSDMCKNLMCDGVGDIGTKASGCPSTLIITRFLVVYTERM